MTRLDANRFMPRLAAVVWAVALTAIGVRVLAARPHAQSVIPVYTTGAERFARGEPLYPPIPAYDLYRNPPGVAAAFVPVAALPPKAGGVLVRGVQVAVLLTGLVRVRRTLGGGWSAANAGWFYLLAAVLVVPAVNNGQLNVLIAGSVLHGVAAAWRGRDWEAATWFALAGAVKLYPLAAGLLCGLTRPRLLPRLGAAFAVLLALPFLAQDPDYVAGRYAEYWHHLRTDTRVYDQLPRVPRDWTAWPRMLLGVVVQPGTAFAVSLAAAGLAAVWVVAARGPLAPRADSAPRSSGPGEFRSRSERATGVRGAFVLSGVWMTVFGPATEANTYTLLAAVAPLVLLDARPGWPRSAAAAGVALLIGTTLRGVFPGDGNFNLYGPQALGTLLVLAGHLGSSAGRRPA